MEEFEAENRQSDEAVAFSVLLGDLNFDNCSQDHAKEQGHKLFSCFQDPCRLGVCQEQPWALGTAAGDNLEFLHATPLHCLLPRDASEVSGLLEPQALLGQLRETSLASGMLSLS